MVEKHRISKADRDIMNAFQTRLMEKQFNKKEDNI
jgi:hypothetical protein